MAASTLHPLPLALDRDNWAYEERSSLGAHGASLLIHRVPVPADQGPVLSEDQARALPMLLHEFDRQEGLPRALVPAEESGELEATPKAILQRLIPRLVSYRFVDKSHSREWVFEGFRPSSLHVLSRVFETDYRFRLDDLSHFATHGEFMLRVLHAVGLPNALDVDSIIYCPAVDSPYPFKFSIVGHGSAPNRDVYVQLLKKLLRKTESDETFRDRNFRELMRGFAKFGPAAATPRFQEVELRLWRTLSYLAARLRVKAGRLTDTQDTGQVRQFLGELRGVHSALDELVHLPSRMAAFFRSSFDLELSELAEHVLTDLDGIAAKLDFDFEGLDRSIDVVATTVATFRGLGSASPLETLEENDRDVKLAYGDVEVEQLERGWARTYTEQIYTGAKRFDTRRYDAISDDSSEEDASLSEEDFELNMDLSFGFGGGGGGGGGGGQSAPAPAEADDGTMSEEEFELGMDLDFGMGSEEEAEEAEEAEEDEELEPSSNWYEGDDEDEVEYDDDDDHADPADEGAATAEEGDYDFGLDVLDDL